MRYLSLIVIFAFSSLHLTSQITTAEDDFACVKVYFGGLCSGNIKKSLESTINYIRTTDSSEYLIRLYKLNEKELIDVINKLKIYHDYVEKRRQELNDQALRLEQEAEGKFGNPGRGPAYRDKKENFEFKKSEYNKYISSKATEIQILRDRKLELENFLDAEKYETLEFTQLSKPNLEITKFSMLTHKNGSPMIIKSSSNKITAMMKSVINKTPRGGTLIFTDFYVNNSKVESTRLNSNIVLRLI